jgi:hypothetical protein
MSDDFKEFIRKSLKEVREELINGLSAQERLAGITADEIIRTLSPEKLEALTRLLNANDASSKQL